VLPLARFEPFLIVNTMLVTSVPLQSPPTVPETEIEAPSSENVPEIATPVEEAAYPGIVRYTAPVWPPISKVAAEAE
jgi:hypothetical protein